MEKLIVKPDGKSPFKPVNIALDKVSCIEDIRKEGFTVFSLGPVYVYANVQESIPARFTMEDFPGTPTEMRHTTMHFERPVITRCELWNYVLDVMDTATYNAFKLWLVNCSFVDRAKHKFFKPKHYFAPCLDPITLDKMNLAVPTSLDIFGVSGVKGEIKPRTSFSGHDKAKSYIEIYKDIPSEDTIVEAKKALNFVENV